MHIFSCKDHREVETHHSPATQDVPPTKEAPSFNIMKSSHLLTTLLPLLASSYSVHKPENLETTAIQPLTGQIILIATVQVTSGLEDRVSAHTSYASTLIEYIF